MRKLIYIVLTACVAAACLADNRWMLVELRGEPASHVAIPLDSGHSVSHITLHATPHTDTVATDTVATDSITTDTLANDTLANDTAVAPMQAMRVVAHYADSVVWQAPLDSIAGVELGQMVPALYIDIDCARDVTSKEEYLDATITLVDYDHPGKSSLDATPVKIKGRGNSTWSFDKKPYRLKFDKKQQIGPLRKGKSFVLLANYIDNTLMRNMVALRTAQLLDIPYTCHYMPVDLYVNGSYRGSYMLTEKVGISANSVDIDDHVGILLELDTNYDEKYKFRSARYNLPGDGERPRPRRPL